VGLRVAEGTVGRNVDLLAAGDNDAERERVLAAGEDGGVAGGAGVANLFGALVCEGDECASWTQGEWATYVGRAVRRRGTAAEVELSTARSQRLEVDGRGAAGRHDAEVAWAGRGGRGLRLCLGGRRHGGRADTGHGAGEEGSGDEDRLHCVGGGVGGGWWWWRRVSEY
jgi:hypothetical protein